VSEADSQAGAPAAAATPCEHCGFLVERGAAGCRETFERLVGRDFSDVRYFRMHRMLVDTYALQHPAQYGRSAKSLAAHLVGLCWMVEGGGDPARGHDALRRWLDGARSLEHPEPPVRRGALTIGDLLGAQDPREHGAAVERWARSTWAAYAPLHALARAWMAAAFERT